MTRFNACEYLLDRRIAAGDGDRLALTGPAGDVTLRASCTSGSSAPPPACAALGLQPEQRLLMFMADSPEFVVVFLAAMRIGAVPVPVSTMLRADGLAELLRDSRARLLAVSPEFADLAAVAAASAPELRGDPRRPDPVPTPAAGAPAGRRSPARRRRTHVYPTDRRLARVLALHLRHHRHAEGGDAPARLDRGGLRDLRRAGAAASARTTGACPRPRCSSPTGWATPCCSRSRSGAAAVLEPAPSRPDVAGRAGRGSTARRCSSPGPRSSPTCCARELPADALAGVRLAASAGEALPAALYQRWTGALRRRHPRRHRHDRDAAHLPVQPARRRSGPAPPASPCPATTCACSATTGARSRPGTPGHAVRPGRVGRDRLLVPLRRLAPGVPGRVAAHRRHLRARTRTATTPASGRTGDMLKASGIWVSPAEVEARLLAHDAVAQAVVVAAHDADGLDKPVAFVVLQRRARSATEDELIAVLPGRPAVVQAAAPDRVRRRATRPRPPARSAGSSCARRPR